MAVPEIKEVLNNLIPISLDELDNVRLMNRIDTKYVLSAGRLPDLISRLNGNYNVLEINENRIFSYLTKYLDTTEYLFFNQHVIGKPERHKVRYRTYEATGTTFLEVKKRTSNNRTIKWRIKNDLTLDNKCDERASEFIKKFVPYKPLILKPVLSSSFKRVTLVGSEYNERVTIDYDISFSDNSGNHASYPCIAIIELKRHGYNYKSNIATILRDLSVHPTGFSKYCIGTSIFNDIPRRNILRIKHLLINRIENEYYRCFSA
jgi:hypothetical protein